MRLTAEAMSFVFTFFQGIRGLNSLAKKLRAKRMEAGALMLASTEVKFVLDADSSDPLDVQVGQGWLQARGCGEAIAVYYRGHSLRADSLEAGVGDGVPDRSSWCRYTWFGITEKSVCCSLWATSCRRTIPSDVGTESSFWNFREAFSCSFLFWGSFIFPNTDRFRVFLPCRAGERH